MCIKTTYDDDDDGIDEDRIMSSYLCNDSVVSIIYGAWSFPPASFYLEIVQLLFSITSQEHI